MRSRISLSIFTRRTPIGIDVGDDSIRAVQLDSRTSEIKAAAMFQLPDPDARDTHQYSNQLRKSLRRAGFTGSRCVLGAPREQIHVHPIRVPHMSSKELHQSLAWEASERFSIPRDSIQVDGVMTGARAPGADDDRAEVVLFALDERKAAAWLDPLMDAGLSPLSLEPGFCAVARAHSLHCRREQDRDRVRVVLDLSARGTTLVYLRGDRIGFCKTFEIGGASLDAATSEALGMDITSARALRRDRLMASARSHNMDGAVQSGASDAVSQLLHRLVEDVALCLRHCAVAFRGARPECIVLSGREALEPGFCEMLESGAGIPVALDDENRTIDSLACALRDKGIRSESASAWTAAFGLASRPVRSGRVPHTTGRAA